MIHKLADETLSAILEPLLEVSDDDFSSTNPGKRNDSPFARIVEHPPADFLTVCKRWMRICTPMLYRTVVIRSQPQAAALAAALKPKANAPLGKYVRKIRIEGGFGTPVKKILMAAPNVTDICVSLDLLAEANVGPMCTVLATAIQPRRLVISLSFSFCERFNKQITRMVETIAQCIGSWTMLETVAMSDVLFTSNESWKPIRRAISSSLHVKQLVFPSNLGINSLGPVCTLAKAAHVQRIVFKQRLSDMERHVLDNCQRLELEVKAKIAFGKEPEALHVAVAAQQIAAQTNTFFTPLSNATQVLRQVIWTLVLREAFDFPINRPPPGKRMRMPVDDHRATQYMLVNREWLDIVRLLAAERVKVTTVAKSEGLLRFSERSELCPWTTHLTVGDLWSTKADDEYAGIVFSNLDRFKGLRCFEAPYLGIFPYALHRLLDASRSSLTSLDVKLRAGIVRVPYMPCLKRLGIAVSDHELTLIAAGSNLFPVLTDLSFKDFTANGDLGPFLVEQRLPQLVQLSFNSLHGGNRCLMRVADSPESKVAIQERTRDFFRQHGAKLEVVKNIGQLHVIKFTLSNCPSLIRLELANTGRGYTCDVPPPSDIDLETPHHNIEELALAHLNSSDPTDEDVVVWRAFFQGIRPEMLPKLRTISSRQCDLWPATLREAPKHPMTAAAEDLMIKGIRLRDGNGVAWKPRLQTKSLRKK